MKYLDEIKTFPREVANALESRYAIATAEAFYGQAVHNPDGMSEAAGVSRKELDRLMTVVEGYLEPGFAEECRKPLVKHPRGLILPREKP